MVESPPIQTTRRVPLPTRTLPSISRTLYATPRRRSAMRRKINVRKRMTKSAELWKSISVENEHIYEGMTEIDTCVVTGSARNAISYYHNRLQLKKYCDLSFLLRFSTLFLQNATINILYDNFGVAYMKSKLQRGKTTYPFVGQSADNWRNNESRETTEGIHNSVQRTGVVRRQILVIL